jgi:hypothetical protein
MDNAILIQSLSKDLAIELPERISLEELKGKLSEEINHLIQTDFQKLVLLLYRIDVNEARLKLLLKEYPGEDASKMIADLIIERQLQKIKSRQQFKQQDGNIDDAEKW